MFDPALAALADLFEPARLLALMAGMVAGIIFGMLPGLGGVAAVSMLLPFIYLLDSFSGLAMLLGAIAVVYTSDTITSVLVGAPGSPASAPTAIEGHALAKQGQAARALSVGFLASMVGGLGGALVLTIAIPVAGPLVLALGTPELFMFALVGLYYASSMVGPNKAKGFGAACLGLLLGTIGPAPAAADFRFTFDQVYLLDGLSLVIVALGLFGIAELVSMLAGGGGIARGRTVMTGWKVGFVDFVRNLALILRSAVIGIFGGFVPAVGASASTWVAYGHAMRSTKDKSRFGRGEIRGIASAEGANNATIISDLVPTVLFSVPGGPASAVFLGALFSFGYYPGPRMVTDSPDLMYLIVWSVALASIVGAFICFVMSPYLARLTQIPFALIAAPLLLVMVVGALQSTNTIGDVFMLLALGCLGWAMKQGGWPRAPALVGFVLAGPMEQYFWLTSQLHGWTWLWRPGVLIIAAFILLPLVWQLFKSWRGRHGDTAKAGAAAEDATPPPSRATVHHRVSLILSGVLLAIFLIAFIEMTGFYADARMLPALAIVPGLAFVVLAGWTDIRALRRDEAAGAGALTLDEPLQLLTLVLYGPAVWVFGFDVATVALLAWILLARAHMRPLRAAVYGACILLAAHGLFELMRLKPLHGVLLPSF
ncbi:MAG: tripartite tricarboxylate transporter permease [Pseudomonadota bacterium]